jgi:ABC-type branched-subunit amino acid transport system substrate-binding protein
MSIQGSILATILTLLLGPTTHAQVGSDKVVLGATLPLSGPVGYDGQARQHAWTALMERVNAEGGVNGRKLEVIAIDDHFEPKKTVENTTELIEKKKVFALISYTSTTNIMAALPQVERAEVPFLVPISGAEPLRRPVRKVVFVSRPGSGAEAEAMVKQVVDELKIKEVAIFSQDDGLGKVGRSSLFSALEARKIKPVSFGSHPVRTDKFGEGLKSVLEGKPKAIFLWTVGKTACDIMKAAREQGYTGIFSGPSPVATNVVLQSCKEAGEGSVLAAGFPSHEDMSFEIVKRFHADMKASGREKEISALTFEGYVNFTIVVEALKRAGKNLTRPIFFKTLESMREVDIGGMKVNYSPTDHEAFKKIYLTQIKDGKAIPLN